MKMTKIARALLSVYEKSGIVDTAKFLHENNIEILSTGGTQKLLAENAIPVVPVEEYTQFPEMMNGRVKTLHPKIHGGILAKREDPSHVSAMESQGIVPIDLVIVNLYPFQQVVSRPDVALSEAIENIDIGGPTMIRAAAKNYNNVVVIVDPDDYPKLLFELKNNKGECPAAFRFELATKAFAHCAAYDAAISNYLSSLNEVQEHPSYKEFSDYYTPHYRKIFDLRYGENPHQKAAYYAEEHHDEPCIANARQLHGKHLSYNNFLDLNAAFELVKEFDEGCCVIVKHNNPCGVALAQESFEAFQKAFSCDPTSAFGGIIALNRPVSAQTALEINQYFFEAVIAPDYEEAALETLKQKKNIRILKTLPIRRYDITGWDMKKIVGGMLIQERDTSIKSMAECEVISQRQPSPQEVQDLDMAWKVAKHVKSNAIVYVKNAKTIGIGAGQMSRVDSVRLGAQKAQESLAGSVMASDAFFPFRDSVDLAQEYGVRAIVQPGGSIRDEEVIAAANEHDIAMIFTGMRHFRH